METGCSPPLAAWCSPLFCLPPQKRPQTLCGAEPNPGHSPGEQRPLSAPGVLCEEEQSWDGRGSWFPAEILGSFYYFGFLLLFLVPPRAVRSGSASPSAPSTLLTLITPHPRGQAHGDTAGTRSPPRTPKSLLSPLRCSEPPPQHHKRPRGRARTPRTLTSPPRRRCLLGAVCLPSGEKGWSRGLSAPKK